MAGVHTHRRPQITIKPTRENNVQKFLSAQESNPLRGIPAWYRSEAVRIETENSLLLNKKRKRERETEADFLPCINGNTKLNANKKVIRSNIDAFRVTQLKKTSRTFLNTEVF